MWGVLGNSSLVEAALIMLLFLPDILNGELAYKKSHELIHHLQNSLKHRQSREVNVYLKNYGFSSRWFLNHTLLFITIKVSKYYHSLFIDGKNDAAKH